MEDSKARARRLLGTLKDRRQRIELMVRAELAEELKQVLPELIADGECRFTNGGTHAEGFVCDDPCAVSLWIVGVEVHFAGLVAALGDEGPLWAANVVVPAVAYHAIVENKVADGNYGVLYAARRFATLYPIHDDIEWNAFRSALLSDGNVASVLKLLPNSPTTVTSVPIEQWLEPLALYLMKFVRGWHGKMDGLVVEVLSSETACSSIEKVIAVLGQCATPHGRKVRQALAERAGHLLRLHFRTKNRIRTDHLTYLIQHGLLSCCRENELPRDIGETFVEQVANGRLAAVEQHLYLFGREMRINQNGVLIGIVLEAFQRALEAGSYGVAAALANHWAAGVVAEAAEVRRVTELALECGCSIRLDSEYVIPPKDWRL